MCEVNKRAIDIDDLDDFIIAEAMAKIINNLIDQGKVKKEYPTFGSWITIVILQLWK